MNCSKCGKDIGNYIACRNCAKVASAIQEHKTQLRYETEAYAQILKGVREVWIQRCGCDPNSRVLHIAFQCWIDYKSVAFCGHNISIGACRGGGGLRPWKSEYKDDPEFCPLCLDRLLNLGNGICRDICSFCGTPDGKHAKRCAFKALENTGLVEKLKGQTVEREA